MNYYQIAVNTPVKDSLFTYQSESKFSVGQMVKVPFGKKIILGVVWRLDLDIEKQKFEKSKIKNIDSLVLEDIFFDHDEITFYSWVSDYYQYPVGKLIFDSLTKILKKPRKKEFLKGLGEPLSFNLTEEQNQIASQMASGEETSFYLYGVTGSGKSIVYLDLMIKIINQSKSVLFLVPEINLTPQFIKFFTKHLACRILVYHSALTDSERFNVWQQLLSSADPIFVIGVRSSIFLPIKNLGLIVVDEEHDQSYKQDDRCPYNTKLLAYKKSKQSQAKIIYGSATPSIELLNQYQLKKNFFKMENRPGNFTMPKIEIIDVRKSSMNEAEKSFFDQNWPLDRKSFEALNQAFNKNEQALILVNRLGYALYVQCRNCGFSIQCPNCSVGLKYFKKSKKLSCQICQFATLYPDECSVCGNFQLENRGFGTEKIEEVITQLFPKIKIARFDRAVIKTHQKLNEVLEQFHRHETDLLIGTQMLSKGHNFEKVNLVVILGIDHQLQFPDFRSHERGLQLLMQVSGRSGRFGKQGTVLVQTQNPKLAVFDFLIHNDYLSFARSEMKVRKQCGFPPFAKLCSLAFSAKNENKLIEFCDKASQVLNELRQKHFPSVSVLGPKPAVIEKRVNNFTWVFLLKDQNVNQLHNLLKSFRSNIVMPSSISFKWDIDPQVLP